MTLLLTRAQPLAVSRALAFLIVLLLFLFSATASIFAASKGGINIGDHLNEFDQAAEALGPDSWVYVMACPGDAEEIVRKAREHSNINVMLRIHYPGEPLTPDYANAWVAALGDIPEGQFAQKQFYIMPANEPNHPPEASDHVPAGELKRYIDTLVSSFNESTLRNRRIRLLSPMFDVHYFTDHRDQQLQYVAELGGSAFFNQFDGIAFNLYGVYFVGDGPDTNVPLIKQGKGYNEFARDNYGVSGLPIYAAESGVTAGGAVKYAPYAGMIAHFYREHAGPGWASDGGFRAFTIFSYDPHGNKAPWIYGNSEVLDAMKSVGGGESVEQALPLDPNLYSSWRSSITIPDFSKKKCGVVIDCCGSPYAIQTPKCAKEVSECRARALLPAKLAGKTRFESAAAGVGSGDVAGVSTLGVRESVCRLVPDWFPGKDILCGFADVSDHLALSENPEKIGKQIVETQTSQGNVRVQAFDPLSWIWGIIAPRTVDEKTGWLGQYTFGSAETEVAGVQAQGGPGGEVIGEFDLTQQKLTPYKLLKAFGGVGIPEGRIPADGAPPPGPGGQPKCSGGVCYYSQRDPAYANEEKMGNCTIRKAGCGPTTVAMIKASFVDPEKWNPISVIDTYYPNANCEGSSGYDAMMALQPEGFEIGETIFYDWDNPKAPSEVVKQMRESTEAGWDLFCSANMYWGDEQGWIGHLFWVTEVTADDEIMVMDPYFGYGYDYPMLQSNIPDRFDPHYKYCIQFKL